MMKAIFLVLIVAFSVYPVFADTTCTRTTGPNGDVITCPNQPTVTASPSFMPTTSTVKDYIHTILGKLTSGFSQNDPNMANVGEQTEHAIDTGIDFFKAIKYVAGALVGYLAPKILGQDLPTWAVPLMMWSMVGIMVYGIMKHAGKMIILGLIIGGIIILVLYVGGSVFLH